MINHYQHTFQYPQSQQHSQLSSHNQLPFPLQNINNKQFLSQIDTTKLNFHKISIINPNDLIFSKITKFNDIYIQVKKQTFHGFTYLFDVIIGCFLLKINLINFQRKADQQDVQIQRNQIGMGGFGSVRVCQVENQQFAIKRIYFKKKIEENNQNLQNVIDFQISKSKYLQINKAIRQYSIYKICSLLEVGPKVIFENQYDLMCFDDCIEFHMQLCQVPYKFHNFFIQRSIQFQQFQYDLKNALKKFHQLNFVHRDIKPQNILYSFQRRRFLITDFGLSHIVKEQPTEKTFTTYSGTLKYSSLQMLNLYNNKCSGYVNLYQNDNYSLQVVLQQFKQVYQSAQNILDNQIRNVSRNSMSFVQSFSNHYSYSPDSEAEYMQSNNNQTSIQSRNNSIINTGGSNSSIPILSTFNTNTMIGPARFSSQINFYQTLAMKHLLAQFIGNPLRNLSINQIQQTVRQKVCIFPRQQTIREQVINHLSYIFFPQCCMDIEQARNMKQRNIFNNRLRILGPQSKLVEQSFMKMIKCNGYDKQRQGQLNNSNSNGIDIMCIFPKLPQPKRGANKQAGDGDKQLTINRIIKNSMSSVQGLKMRLDRFMRRININVNGRSQQGNDNRQDQVELGLVDYQQLKIILVEYIKIITNIGKTLNSHDLKLFNLRIKQIIDYVQINKQHIVDQAKVRINRQQQVGYICKQKCGEIYEQKNRQQEQQGQQEQQEQMERQQRQNVNSNKNIYQDQDDNYNDQGNNNRNQRNNNKEKNNNDKRNKNNQRNIKHTKNNNYQRNKNNIYEKNKNNKNTIYSSIYQNICQLRHQQENMQQQINDKYFYDQQSNHNMHNYDNSNNSNSSSYQDRIRRQIRQQTSTSQLIMKAFILHNRITQHQQLNNYNNNNNKNNNSKNKIKSKIKDKHQHKHKEQQKHQHEQKHKHQLKYQHQHQHKQYYNNQSQVQNNYNHTNDKTQIHQNNQVQNNQQNNYAQNNQIIVLEHNLKELQHKFSLQHHLQSLEDHQQQLQQLLDNQQQFQDNQYELQNTLCFSQDKFQLMQYLILYLINRLGSSQNIQPQLQQLLYLLQQYKNQLQSIFYQLNNNHSTNQLKIKQHYNNNNLIGNQHYKDKQIIPIDKNNNNNLINHHDNNHNTNNNNTNKYIYNHNHYNQLYLRICYFITKIYHHQQKHQQSLSILTQLQHWYLSLNQTNFGTYFHDHIFQLKMLIYFKLKIWSPAIQQAVCYFNKLTKGKLDYKKQQNYDIAALNHQQQQCKQDQNQNQQLQLKQFKRLQTILDGIQCCHQIKKLQKLWILKHLADILFQKYQQDNKSNTNNNISIINNNILKQQNQQTHKYYKNISTPQNQTNINNNNNKPYNLLQLLTRIYRTIFFTIKQNYQLINVHKYVYQIINNLVIVQTQMGNWKQSLIWLEYWFEFLINQSQKQSELVDLQTELYHICRVYLEVVIKFALLQQEEQLQEEGQGNGQQLQQLMNINKQDNSNRTVQSTNKSIQYLLSTQILTKIIDKYIQLKINNTIRYNIFHKINNFNKNHNKKQNNNSSSMMKKKQQHQIGQITNNSFNPSAATTNKYNLQINLYAFQNSNQQHNKHTQLKIKSIFVQTYKKYFPYTVYNYRLLSLQVSQHYQKNGFLNKSLKYFWNYIQELVQRPYRNTIQDFTYCNLFISILIKTKSYYKRALKLLKQYLFYIAPSDFINKKEAFLMYRKIINQLNQDQSFKQILTQIKNQQSRSPMISQTNETYVNKSKNLQHKWVKQLCKNECQILINRKFQLLFQFQDSLQVMFINKLCQKWCKKL